MTPSRMTMTDQPNPSYQSRNSTLVAHRGGAGLWLENSLPAFRDAIEKKYPAIECDIQLTRDHKLLIYHDFTLNTLYTEIPVDLNAQSLIQELSTSDIKKLILVDLSHDIRSPIPFVEDLFDLLLQSKNRPFLFAEIKTSPVHHTQSHVECLVDKLIALAESYQYLDNMTLLSFDWRGLVYAQKKSSHIPLTFIYCDSTHEPRENNLWLGPYSFKNANIPFALKDKGAALISVPYHLMTIEFMKNCTEAGLKTNVWTVNTPDEITRFQALGVDYITTDFPNFFSE